MLSSLILPAFYYFISEVKYTFVGKWLKLGSAVIILFFIFTKTLQIVENIISTLDCIWCRFLDL